MVLLTSTPQLLQLMVSFTLVLTSSPVVKGAPATTGAVVIEISDGQIQNPVPTKSGLSLFKATDVAGDEVFYVASVGQNTLGSSTTDVLGTVEPVTTTDLAGSAISGLAEASETSGSITSIIPVSAIPTLLSIPPSFAFTTVDGQDHSIVNLAQTFTRVDGSISTAVILSDISTSYLTTTNAQGSTVFETLGLFTRSNGSVTTNTLSFVADSSSLTLSMPVASMISPPPLVTNGYQSSMAFSGTDTDRGTASMNRKSRFDTTSVKPTMSTDSSSSDSSSLRNSEDAQHPALSQASASKSVDTLSAAIFSVDTTASSSPLQSPGAYAALQNPINQSTSAISHPTSKIMSAVPSARNSFSWSQVVSGSDPTAGSSGTTIGAGKSEIPARGQASLSASATIGINMTYNTAGGGLILAAQSDAALAESLTAAWVGQQVSTITTIPPGMVVQSITTKTKCSHAFAMATTTSSGNTLTTVVPKLCHDDAAFLLFPGVAIPLLCKSVLSVLGFLLRWICDPKTEAPVGVDDITGLPPSPKAGGGSTEPNPNDDPQSEEDEPTNSRDSSDRASSTGFLSTNLPSSNLPSTRMSFTSFPSTSRPSSTMTTSISSAVANPYYLFGSVGDEAEVSELLGALNNKYKALEPAIGSTPMSRADWVNINLTDPEVTSLSSNPDVLLIAPYISLTESASVTGNEVSTSASFSTFSKNPSSTSNALFAASSSSLASLSSRVSKAKIRRQSPTNQFGEDELSAREHNDTESVMLTKRDFGMNIIAQYGSDKEPCPRDLAVVSWAPGVPAVLNYPYIFLQSQGEGTWAYLVSSGIDSGHVDFKGNWGPDSSQTNVDPNPLDVPGMYPGGSYDGITGTCYASKICGRVSGVAKQATVIPMRTHGFGPQWLIAVLHNILGDIPSRRQKNPPQCLPGKTVVVITFDYDLTNKKLYELSFEQQDYAKSMLLNAIKAIQDLGVIVIVLAGDETVDITASLTSNNVPQALASKNPLIRVGSVDISGKITLQSKKGDVYMVGQDFVCGEPSFLPFPLQRQNKYITNGFGTAGAAAAFAGLVLYDLSRPIPPFELGDDITQYQAKAFAYYTTEGKGSYTRDGGNAQVGWNGLDNSDPNQCPALRRKRDGSDGGACEMQLSTSVPPTTVTTSTLKAFTATTANASLLAAVGVIAGGIAAGEAAGTTYATGLTQKSTSIPHTSASTTLPTTTATPLACTQYFYYSDDGPNSFVCQCSDSTWNHLRNDDVYSECPSQVSTVSLTTATPSATVPSGVSCSLVVFGPTAINYGNFCECDNSMFWGGGCPTWISVAATTTFTFSKPPASVTAALTVGDFIKPTPIQITAACVPQCTKLAKLDGPHGVEEQADCYCNPACGGNAHPTPNGNNICPNQVTVIA